MRKLLKVFGEKKIVLNMSNKCNLKCKYCYADGGKYASKKDELMSVEIFESIIEEILGEGVSRIGIVSFLVENH